MSLAEDGSPSISLLDAKERPRARLGVTEMKVKPTGAEIKTAENTLMLFDEKGDVIWQAPR